MDNHPACACHNRPWPIASGRPLLPIRHPFRIGPASLSFLNFLFGKTKKYLKVFLHWAGKGRRIFDGLPAAGTDLFVF
jgi:hypothetical protein